MADSEKKNKKQIIENITEKFRGKKNPGEMSPEERNSYYSHKKAQRIRGKNNFKRVGIIIAVIFVCAVAVSFVAVSCINDVLAVHVSDKDGEEKSVVITENMDTDSVIDTLKKDGVIHNAWFCKICAKAMGYKDDGYVPGTYTLSRKSGLENMLNSIKYIDSQSQTVTLTFPEGYTADEIIKLLGEKEVCDPDKLRQAMNSDSFSKDYDFLSSRTNLSSRYNQLEGYLYPDTYNFYIGEAPESVIKKFLDNFESKWTDEYSALAKKKGMTVDQVVILASIVQKEAKEDEMTTVSSILINRLNANMHLSCNSTTNYAKAIGEGLSEADKQKYVSLYDTYTCDSYPASAICSPGDDSIRAVLNAPDTDYYYFMHDKNGEFHAARNLDEQNANMNTYGVNN